MKPRLQRLIDLVYPPRCPFCGQLLGPLETCPDCAPLLRRLELSPPRLPESEYHLGELRSAAALYRYEGLARQGVLRLKIGAAPHAARWLGARLATLYGCDFSAAYGTIQADPPALPPADVIVSAPASHRRSWDHTGLLARRLSRALGAPAAPGVLVKRPGARPQSGLSGPERLRNARGSVRVARPELVEGRRVLLVDDVVTTGGTAADCARALLKAGAISVELACLAAVCPSLGSLPPADKDV